MIQYLPIYDAQFMHVCLRNRYLELDKRYIPNVLVSSLNKIPERTIFSIVNMCAKVGFMHLFNVLTVPHDTFSEHEIIRKYLYWKSKCCANILSGPDSHGRAMNIL